MTGGQRDERVVPPGSNGDEQGPGRPHTSGYAGDTGGARAERVQAQEEPVVAGELSAELAAVRRERDDYLDMLRRVQADFENYKKRMMRQQSDLLERAAEGLVVRLLPVLDAFDLARAHLEAEGSPEGKVLLQAAGLLEDTLAKEGLVRVDAVGVAFDPTTHEAVEHQPRPASGSAGAVGAEPDAGTEDGAPDGPVVTDVLRAGYRYKGRVVRPAMVRVTG